MEAFDEGDVVRRCREGDERAFAELVDRFKDLVFALVSRTVADRGRAEDLAQEVFLRIHRGLPYFRGEAKLSTWIYRIAANLCAQEQGRAARQRYVSLDERREGAPRLEPSTVDPGFDDLELRDRLDKALAELPPQLRFLVAAHYLEGVQYEELADAVGMPLGTLKTHLHRAKRRLREVLLAAPHEEDR
jgi:RNA polymerase sigma-70 factor (ECF subfamily)